MVEGKGVVTASEGDEVPTYISEEGLTLILVIFLFLYKTQGNITT